MRTQERTLHADSLADLIRPVAWIALAGFTLGFCGYLILGLRGAGLTG